MIPVGVGRGTPRAALGVLMAVGVVNVAAQGKRPTGDGVNAAETLDAVRIRGHLVGS